MPKPNIILISTDQQRYDTVNALGEAHMVTPSLDRLVSEGTAFTNNFCTAPSCVPSRSSFRRVHSWYGGFARHTCAG